MESQQRCLDRALSYRSSGLSVIPIKTDGSKAPDLVEWKHLMDSIPSEHEVSGWYAGGSKRGVGIICGKVSGGLEVLDFDQPGFFEPWVELVEAECPTLLGRLPVIKTPKGYGRHVYYRCVETGPGAKLARVPTKEGRGPWNVAIESRGERQYVVAPGSPPECHPSGRTYEEMGGHPFIEDVPVVTPEERKVLLTTAKGLNIYVEMPKCEVQALKANIHGGRPGDDFCRRGSWEKLLEESGWTCVKQTRGGKLDGVSFWRRPGKTDPGCSATLGHCHNDRGDRLLYVFSTNAAPFNTDRAYNLFSAYAILRHGGDFKAAASQLARDGFGGFGTEEFRAEIQTTIALVAASVQDQPLEALDALMPTLKIWIENQCVAVPAFKPIWANKRKDFENPDQYDTSVIWYANDGELTIEDAIRLCYWRRLRHHVSPEKALDPTYMAAKLSRTYCSEARTDIDVVTDVEVQGVSETGGVSGHVQAVRTRLNLPDFDYLLQSGREDASFEVVFTDGEQVPIGPAKGLVSSQKELESRLIVFRDHLGFPPIANWKLVLQHMLRTKRFDPVVDEHPVVIALEWVEDYLAAHTVQKGGKIPQARIDRDPYLEGDRVFVHAEAMFHWLEMIRKLRGVTRPTYWRFLRRCGFTSTTVSCPGSSRTYWSRAPWPVPQSEREHLVGVKFSVDRSPGDEDDDGDEKKVAE